MWCGFPRAEGDRDKGSFTFSRRDEIPALAGQLASLCANAEVVALGLNELMLNSIEHGLLGIGLARKRSLIESGHWLAEIDFLESRPGRPERVAVLNYRRISELICVTISDPGRGFDFRPYMALDPARSTAPNGRGVAIARLLCFEALYYRNGGREVEALALAR